MVWDEITSKCHIWQIGLGWNYLQMPYDRLVWNEITPKHHVTDWFGIWSLILFVQYDALAWVLFNIYFFLKANFLCLISAFKIMCVISYCLITWMILLCKSLLTFFAFMFAINSFYLRVSLSQYEFAYSLRYTFYVLKVTQTIFSVYEIRTALW